MNPPEVDQENRPSSFERNRQADIDRIRGFNRFYTKRIGVLGQLETEMPLSEARLIFEIKQLGKPSSGDLAAALGLDPGYVSRQVSKLADRGYLEKKRSEDDGRRHHLILAENGLELHRRLTEKANSNVAEMLSPLDGAGRRRLVGAMGEIERILGGHDEPEVRIREHGPGDLGWVLERHGELYREFYGFDHRFEAIVAKILADFAMDHDERRERLWIADAGGQRLGSIMLVHDGSGSDVARLRLFLVEPHARGRGVGTRLIDSLIDFARRRDYRSMVLTTVDALHAARHLYERVGFRLIKSYPHRDWSIDVLEQEWRLETL